MNDSSGIMKLAASVHMLQTLQLPAQSFAKGK
jgi:hypothetical protein